MAEFKTKGCNEACDEIIGEHLDRLISDKENGKDITNSYEAGFIDGVLQEAGIVVQNNAKPICRILVEIMREINGFVYPSGVFTHPGNEYKIMLTDGRFVYIGKTRLKQLLYDHCSDTIFKNDNMGVRIFAVLPKQLLIDNVQLSSVE